MPMSFIQIQVYFNFNLVNIDSSKDFFFAKYYNITLVLSKASYVGGNKIVWPVKSKVNSLSYLYTG